MMALWESLFDSNVVGDQTSDENHPPRNLLHSKSDESSCSVTTTLSMSEIVTEVAEQHSSTTTFDRSLNVSISTSTTTTHHTHARVIEGTHDVMYSNCATQIQRWIRRRQWNNQFLKRCARRASGYVNPEKVNQPIRFLEPPSPLCLQRSSSDHTTNLRHLIWPETSRELLVLLVFANPQHTSPLRLQTEEKAIRAALNSGTFHSNIVLDVLPAATVDDLAKQLLRRPYHVIHFSGHADRLCCLMQHMIERFRTEHGIDPDALKASSSSLQEVQTAVDAAVTTIEHLVTHTSSHHEHSNGTITANADVIDVCSNNSNSSSSYSLTNGRMGQLQPASLALPTYRLSAHDTLFNEDIKVAIDVTINSSRIQQHVSTREVLDLGVGALAFETESGDLSFVRPESFARMLASYSPPLQCVILNACGSKLQGGVLSQVVPLTICFGCKVADKESLAFSEGFYDALGNGRAYEDAYIEGARRMELHALDPGVPFRRTSLPVNKSNLYPITTTNQQSTLVSLFRNVDLLNQLEHYRYADRAVSIPPNQTLHVNGRSWTVTDVEEMATMNSQLKSLIAYGVKLLESKDEEISALREQLRNSVGSSTPTTTRLLTSSNRSNSSVSDKRKSKTLKPMSPSINKKDLLRKAARQKPPSPNIRISVAQRTTAASRAAQVSKKPAQTPREESITNTKKAPVVTETRQVAPPAATYRARNEFKPQPVATAAPQKRTGDEPDGTSDQHLRRIKSFANGPGIPRIADTNRSLSDTKGLAVSSATTQKSPDNRTLESLMRSPSRRPKSNPVPR